MDLGGDWGPDRTITMDLSAHEAGTIVKNTGSVQWKVTAYPGAGCSVWKVRQDLLLSVPLPEGKDYSLYVWIAVAASLGAVAVAGLYFLRVKSR